MTSFIFHASFPAISGTGCMSFCLFVLEKITQHLLLNDYIDILVNLFHSVSVSFWFILSHIYMKINHTIFSICICTQTDISLNKMTRRSECDMRLKILQAVFLLTED